MRKLLLVSGLVGLTLVLTISGILGCAEEEERELLPPQLRIAGITKEKTTDFSPTTLDALVEYMGAGAYGTAMTIRSATMEMALEINNPNDFEISLGTLIINASVDGLYVENPNFTDRIYVPAETSVVVRRVFSVKQLDVYVTLTMFQGKSAADAMAETGALLEEIIAGTATWDLECRASISSALGDILENYQLSWTKTLD